MAKLKVGRAFSPQPLDEGKEVEQGEVTEDATISTALSRYNYANIGTLKVSKGRLPNGLVLFSWDAVHECTNMCRAFELCSYSKGGKCTLTLAYMRSVEEVVLQQFGASQDQGKLFRIGMHLLPLYHQLCRLKIEEAGFNRVVYTTDKGGYKANPVLKEIRDVLFRIEAMWLDLGLDATAPLTIHPPHPSSGMTIIPVEMNGKGHYARMEGGVADKTRRVVRRKKEAEDGNAD